MESSLRTRGQDKAEGGWSVGDQVKAMASLARSPTDSQWPVGGASLDQLSREAQGQDP